MLILVVDAPEEDTTDDIWKLCQKELVHKCFRSEAALVENISVPYIRISLLLTNLLSAYNIRGKRVVVLGGAHHKMPPPQVVVKLPLLDGNFFYTLSPIPNLN